MKENIYIPLGHIIIKKDPVENVTKTGFFLPETAAEKDLTSGTVIACGPRIPDDIYSHPIVEGTKVLFVKWAASDFEYEGEKYQIIRYEDVRLGILNEKVS